MRPADEQEGVVVAPERVEGAVLDLARRLAQVDPELRSRYAVDRTVSCEVSDLGVIWSGRLCADGLLDLASHDVPRAQVRLVVTSEDLLALAEGRMTPGAAWAQGRLRVQASPLDLLRLRALL